MINLYSDFFYYFKWTPNSKILRKEEAQSLSTSHQAHPSTSIVLS